MKDETRKKLEFWLGNFPKSYHTLNMDRFHDFLYTMLENEDMITAGNMIEILKEKQPQWSDIVASEFADQWETRIHAIKQAIDYGKEYGRISSNRMRSIFQS